MTVDYWLLFLSQSQPVYDYQNCMNLQVGAMMLSLSIFNFICLSAISDYFEP